MWYYIAIGFAIDIILTYVFTPLGFKKAWVGNMFMLIEFVLISLYFRKQLDKKPKKNIIYFIVFVGAVFCYRTIQHSVFSLNLFDASLLHCICILYGIGGLYLMLKSQKVLQLETSEIFWSNVAFIIYFSGNFMLFLFYDLVKDQKETIAYLWAIIHLTINVLYHIIFTIALTRKNA